MSEMIIVECDYKDGECLERLEGFQLTASERFRHHFLRNEGWLVVGEKHYCPKHKEQALKEQP